MIYYFGNHITTHSVFCVPSQWIIVKQSFVGYTEEHGAFTE